MKMMCPDCRELYARPSAIAAHKDLVQSAVVVDLKTRAPRHSGICFICVGCGARWERVPGGWKLYAMPA